MIQTQIERITPAYATEVLENHNPKNRIVSEMTVQSYAGDMRNGKWLMTHQGLGFDTNGNLVDGQHRLWAVVFSGVTVEFLVTRGLPVETDGLYTMDVVDRNRTRTTGQQMGLCHNIRNGTTVAAAMRSIAGICSPKALKGRISTSTSLAVHDIYGTQVERLINCSHSHVNRRSYILAPLTIYCKGEQEKACDLMTQLDTLIDMGSQTRAIKKFIDTRPGNLPDITAARIVANGIHAFHTGKVVQRLQDNPNGQEFLIGMFPSITRKIVELTTPCRVVIARRRTRNVKDQTV